METAKETKKEKEQRTKRQNRAMHLYFTQLAEALNDGGFTVQIVLKQKTDIDWNLDLVKNLLWRTAQQVILHKNSTTELNKQKDIDMVYEHLNRHISEKWGVHVPFPSEEEMIERAELLEK